MPERGEKKKDIHKTPSEILTEGHIFGQRGGRQPVGGKKEGSLMSKLFQGIKRRDEGAVTYSEKGRHRFQGKG